MTSDKRDFIDIVEELMEQGQKVAVPAKPEEMDDIRRTMKKSIEEYKNTQKDDRVLRR